MRIAIVVSVLVVGVSSVRAEPCTDAESCATACSARDTNACTRAAEDIFDGKHGASFDPKRSFTLAKTACDASDAYGCTLLGYHYQDGSGTAWDPGLAVTAYSKACKGGSGVGCYNLAGMYGGGHGVDPDPAKYKQLVDQAAAAWRKQCNGTDTRWCSNLGFSDETNKNMAAAAKDYERGCKSGDPIACAQQARVGLTRKTMTPAAFVEAVDKLCTGGEAVACGMLASFLLDDNSGIPADKARGVKLALRACEGGDARACADVGFQHASGDGAAKDLDAADRYLQRSCDHRYAAACAILAKERAGRGRKAEAVTFAQRGCEMANADACEMIAAAMLSTSATDAIKWVREACRQGKVTACDVLIDRDLPLPLPADLKARLYREACNVGRNIACKHSK